MGFTITIGNAIPIFNKDDGELYASWDVEDLSLEMAPTFVNDGLTNNSNCRCPSYSVWDEFLKYAGLHELFMNKYDGLMRDHPGCFIIEKSHYNLVKAALDNKKLCAQLPPGFNSEEDCISRNIKYDAHLARLIWLEFWMKYAVDNCETPAIQNG